MNISSPSYLSVPHGGADVDPEEEEEEEGEEGGWKEILTNPFFLCKSAPQSLLTVLLEEPHLTLHRTATLKIATTSFLSLSPSLLARLPMPLAPMLLLLFSTGPLGWSSNLQFFFSSSFFPFPLPPPSPIL